MKALITVKGQMSVPIIVPRPAIAPEQREHRHYVHQVQVSKGIDFGVIRDDYLGDACGGVQSLHTRQVFCIHLTRITTEEEQSL